MKPKQRGQWKLYELKEIVKGWLKHHDGNGSIIISIRDKKGNNLLMNREASDSQTDYVSYLTI